MLFVIFVMNEYEQSSHVEFLAKNASFEFAFGEQTADARFMFVVDTEQLPCWVG